MTPLIFLFFGLLFIGIGIWFERVKEVSMLYVLLGTASLIWFLVKIIYRV